MEEPAPSRQQFQGTKASRIEIVAYDPAWPDRFAELGRELRAGLGYAYRADNPERTKRYLREPPGRPRTHVHVRRAGSFWEQWALLFRDYLRTPPPWSRPSTGR
jgi:GrpB-like predicted nucleotidyltransferase (UPF0157 family)